VRLANLPRLSRLAVEPAVGAYSGFPIDLAGVGEPHATFLTAQASWSGWINIHLHDSLHERDRTSEINENS
jgi:hypothetical protein